MNAKPKFTGWWQTLPGILTATAAILTAIGGLIVAFHQAGFLEKSRQAQNDTTRPAKVTESSGPRESTPSATKQTSLIHQTYSVTLPAETEVRGRGDIGVPVVYKIVDARLDRYGPNKLALRFKMRLTNNGGYQTGFWEASFRLLTDGVSYAPESFYAQGVPPHSAREELLSSLKAAKP